MMSRDLLCWILLSFLLISNVESETFLEKQKRIAEEHWKRDQEAQLKQEVSIEGDGGSEYYYYYGTEADQSEYEEQEEEAPPPPKKHGYQKSSSTFSRKPGPLSLSSLLGEFKDQLNCLTESELTHEVDRVVCLVLEPTLTTNIDWEGNDKSKNTSK
jgi:hypothetical protein